MYQLARGGIIWTAALLCWPAPILAGPTVPYQDRISGAGAILAVSPPTVTVHIVGTGVATHLGRCRLSPYVKFFLPGDESWLL